MGAEEEEEMEFGTDEDKVKVVDKMSGWHSKTVQKNDA